MITPGAVRTLIAAKLDTLLGFATVWAYEPENLGKLPAVALLMRRIDPKETATGPRIDVEWFWDLRIYVGLSDFAAAQAQLEQLCFETLTLWRDDPTLGSEVEWWRVADLGEPPVFDAKLQWLRKSLTVSAVIEHVPLPPVIP